MPKRFIVTAVLRQMTIRTADTAVVDIGEGTFHWIVRSKEASCASCLAADGTHE
jgi:hypothetical protein